MFNSEQGMEMPHPVAFSEPDHCWGPLARQSAVWKVCRLKGSLPQGTYLRKARYLSVLR